MISFIPFLISFCGFFSHPVYVSVVNMDINVQEKKFTMSLKVFTDDMETVLHNKYGIDGWMGTSQEHEDGRRLINEYVSEHFAIEINGNEKLTPKTDSMVIREEALWIYMKAVSMQPIRDVEIDNRMLTDFFRTQTNLVIIGVGGEEKGYKLDRKKHKIELSL